MRHRPFLLTGAVLLVIMLAWLVHATGTSPLDSFAQCALAGYVVSDTNPPICAAAREIYLGPVAPPHPAPVTLTTQNFNLLVDGDSSSNYPRGWQVIASQATWVKYWSQIHAALASLPPLLPVEFAQNNVIALSEGREPTSGYSIKITNIASGPAGSVVDISESIPTITCQVTPNPSTNRYYIVDTTKLTPPITFKVTPELRHC